MRKLVLAAAMAVYMLSAQTPDPVRGMVDGKRVTQAELETLLNLVPDQAQRTALSANPDELLRYYGFVVRMAAMAEKAKLEEMSPYKEQLELGRKTVLAVAQMEQYARNLNISNAEVEKYYEDHQPDFTVANVTVVQIPIKNDAEADAAKAKSEELWKQVKGGADFSELAKKYPVDGDFHSFKKSDPIPVEIKDAVFALKPGAVSRPIPRPNAVFLIRLDSTNVASLQEKRGDILKLMQDAKIATFMDGVRKSVVIGK
jgi:parvulin-like peptidyl-prolyl isomerase